MYGDLCQPWPHIWCGDLEGINPAITGDALVAASETLWMATGHRFGNCAVPIRPCRRDCASHWPQDFVWSNGVLYRGSTWGWPWPSLVNGVWLNMACGVCQGDCSCTTISEVVLEEPVNSITSVKVDGVTLVKNVDYVVYDGRRFVRAGGETWPTCQDWTVTGGAGTFIIETSVGADVPRLGQLAVGELALELARLCSGEDCNLPASTVRVVRQGVTMERLSPKDLLDNGLVGLWICDQFINRFNPYRLIDRARAYSPDMMTPRIQT